jgi:hypothetical protein
MKIAVMTAALMLAALGARAEMPQMLGSDPLSRQILTKTAQENGGVTAAVRVGTGQTIELKLVEVTSSPSAAPITVKMAPAATSAYLALNPAPGLAPKPAKAKAKKAPKHAVDQLKHVSAAKSWTEKP